MKKFAFIPLAAIVTLGACDANPTAFATEDANLRNGVSSKVETTATGSISVGGSTAYLGLVQWTGNVADGVAVSNGTCWLNSAGLPGRFRNNGGNFANTFPHDNCKVVVPGATYNVTFEVGATHVKATSGNEHLNFADLIVYSEDEEGNVVETIASANRSIQYQHRHNRTTGSGTLTGTDQTGGVWTIDLAQISTDGNTIVPAGMILDAVHATHGTAPVTLTW